MRIITRFSLRIILAGGIAALMLALPRPVRSDVAPPSVPPGTSVEPGQPATYVRMEAEEVLVTIAAWEAPIGEEGFLRNSVVSANWMKGHVEATFVMRNEGDSEETFDVRFPLGVPDGFFEVARAENFAAWVDDVPALVREGEEPWAFDTDVALPWAYWQVTFPPGQPVILRVAYDVKAGGYLPFGNFVYVLETGAGWYDSIGEGTITIRLPYEVNETNTVLNTDERYEWMAPAPGTFEVSGTDVVWRFSNLEPTSGDNISLYVLDPHRWLALESARQQAAANPDSAEAYSALARTTCDTLDLRRGVAPIGNWASLLVECKTAFARAIELAPDDAQLYGDYADILVAEWVPYEPSVPPDGLLPVLERGLELDPQNEHLLDAQFMVDQFALTPTPNPTPVPTVTPERTPEKTPASSPTPQPTPGSGSGLCSCLPGIVFLPMAVFWAGRLRRDRQTSVRRLLSRRSGRGRLKS